MIHYMLAVLFLMDMVVEFVGGYFNGGLGWLNAAIWVALYGYHIGGRK